MACEALGWTGLACLVHVIGAIRAYSQTLPIVQYIRTIATRNTSRGTGAVIARTYATEAFEDS